MVIEFESTHVGITAVFLLLVVVDIAGNTLVCLIIKRHLQTRCVQNVRIRKQVHLLLDFRNAGWEVAFLTVPSMYLFSLRIKTIVCTAFWTRFFFWRITINYLLVNLAVSDILFATFITPKVIVSLNLRQPNGVAGLVLCKLLTGGNLAWIPGITSVFTLVAISFERYYTVVYPLDPNRKLTQHKLKVSWRQSDH